MSTRIKAIATTTALVVVASAALSVATIGPAMARTTVVVDGTRFSTSNLMFTRLDCGDPVVPATGEPSVATAIDPEAPFGDRLLTIASDGSTGGSGPLAPVRNPVKVESISGHVSSTQPVSDVAAVVRFRADGSSSVWWGLAPIEGVSDGMTEVEAADLTYTWSEISDDGRRLSSGGEKTIPEFFSTSLPPGRAKAGFLLGCNGGATRLDGLTVTEKAQDRLWNFEGAQPKLDIDFASGRVTYGNSVKVQTKVSSVEPGAKSVVLERKSPSGDVVEVRRETVDLGRDAFTMNATHSGLYRLSLASTAVSEAATSDWTRLRVPAKVTASPSAKSVRQGRTFTVSGKVLPGARVSAIVQRLSGGKWQKVAAKRVSGSYSIGVLATPVGTHSYRVRTSRTSNNDAGTSRRFTVSVTSAPSGGGTGGGDTGGGGGGGGDNPPGGPQRPVV